MTLISVTMDTFLFCSEVKEEMIERDYPPETVRAPFSSCSKYCSHSFALSSVNTSLFDV